ncbi:MOSC domain-containing protein [Nocardioides marmoriginsengisoli]|uniref:MOSC domain-containing protein n=1 Tax=Nocardioides marmoriginsengisoli TaxID=661483 RepID=A0A3N0CN61_9ACTN|nr:MOSC N-terminal beta barrel domain-containing protein [Nocardioides marmoriginsengisoli]RNL64908.1 MOSC domain-containing protein [Nocardioides marmoriginsengisoli]
MNVGTVAELWRYPVKSMGGERIESSVVDERALHGDRMWAVRDLELNAVTTARRIPALLGCTARFVEEPAPGIGPGDVADVVVTFPDGTRIASTDREALDARLSDLAGKRVALVPLPPLHDKAAYRGVLASKKDIRQQFGIADGEALPDLSMFPVRKLAELSIYATPIGIFADAYPVHLVTTASLRTMAAHGGDFDVRRFRPNIVVDTGLDGLAEQDWIGGTLHAGEVSARIEIPTVRCTVPLREQAGVPADPAVMRAVSRYGDRCLGVYADIATTGTLRVGDAVDLDPPPSQGAVSASLGRMAGRLKRNALRTGNRILPR